MRSTWNTYLPWGERSSKTITTFLLVAFGGAGVGFIGHWTSSDIVKGVGGIVAAMAIILGAAFIIIAAPFIVIRSLREFREVWNRPPVNRHKDWKP